MARNMRGPLTLFGVAALALIVVVVWKRDSIIERFSKTVHKIDNVQTASVAPNTNAKTPTPTATNGPKPPVPPPAPGSIVVSVVDLQIQNKKQGETIANLTRQLDATKARNDSLTRVNTQLIKNASTVQVQVKTDPRVIEALERIADQPRVVAASTQPAVSPPSTQTAERMRTPLKTIPIVNTNLQEPTPVLVSVNELPATTAPEQTARIITVSQEAPPPPPPHVMATGSTSSTSTFSGQPDLLPTHDGDVYGEVSSQDPWDWAYDFDTGTWHYAAWSEFPKETAAWVGSYDPDTAYLFGLGGVDTTPVDPTGNVIAVNADGSQCLEWTFRSKASHLKLNFPIRVGGSKIPVAWGIVMQSGYCYIEQGGNGFAFDLSTPGKPRPSARLGTQ